MYFLYGANAKFVDVTADVFAKCRYGNRIHIPAGDTGDSFFVDPLPGIAKSILVVRPDGDVLSAALYGPNERVWLSLPEELREPVGSGRNIELPPPGLTTEQICDFFHNQIDFAGDSIKCEWVEQRNVADYLDPGARVLELGSGFGTNTMLIACILNDESNLVTLECDQERLALLRRNREANGFRFHIVPAALSRSRLMYNPEAMVTIPSEELRDGWEWIDTVTFDEIRDRFGIEFDTLVADCEGALYYILAEEHHLLDNIRTVILESDYRVVEHKWAVEAEFAKYGFVKVKRWILADGPPDIPRECLDSFWEVWKR